MKDKKIDTFISDDVLEEFYELLADEDSYKLRRLHIPHSSVFYVREKIFVDTGVKYTLDRVERAMYLEGHLSADDVFEPDEKRDWE